MQWLASVSLIDISIPINTGLADQSAQYASTESFPSMIASPMGVWGTFLFFAFCCLATL
jgi:hypothetical protein